MTQRRHAKPSSHRLAKRAVAIGVPLVVLAGSSLAYAAWTQSGSGSAAATAKTAVASVVTAGTTTADLYPGKTGGALYLTVTNPNPYPVTFTGLTPGTITADAGHGGCTTTGVTVSTTVSLLVPAGSTGTTFSPALVSMDNTSLNACQGATFTIPVTLSGTS